MKQDFEIIKNNNRLMLSKGQKGYLVFKRIADFLSAFLLFLVLLPLFLILCLMVLCFVGYPIFFCQPRPGKNGKIFKLIKFRSMNNKRDDEGNLLPDKQRITKFGRVLRATSLDEIPQLLNIIAGQMSVVGPRPRLVKDTVFYGEDVFSLQITPGLTGLSQVKGRNNNTWEQVFEYDKKYIQKLSLWQDIKIFFLTFKVVLFRRGVNTAGQYKDYYYGDFLLRTKQITQQKYDAGQAYARKIFKDFKDKKIKTIYDKV